MATVSSPINLGIPQQPRLVPSPENSAVYGEFQSVYNALRNLWLALTAFEGGGGEGVWGSITGDITTQADLMLRFQTINTNIATLAARIDSNDTDIANIVVEINEINLELASKLGDAPSNGQEYVRKNGMWVISSGGSGGGGVFMPMVAGDIPPTLLYDPDGNLIYAQVE